ncbi:ATP-binding protein [Streptomyces sp. NBC_01381]|uniref:ATP-binding protein n=1 Tax=Streptomyces sp. NBC_01381 TaxID=2903845 RepID=UPI002251E120|nr:ATP-binding protein [Streptomyces sp. NBC_01381]MCX4673659.1 ATP-binding protein [Streptomyces sp. NBC_01381]
MLRLSGSSKQTPGDARAKVGTTLTDWGVAEAVRRDLQLIVSELTTNSVTYTRSPEVVVSVTLTDKTAAVSVDDQGPHRHLSPQSAGPEAEHGRGLWLVATVASRWEQSETDDGGTTVRAEIDLPSHQLPTTPHATEDTPDAPRDHP